VLIARSTYKCMTRKRIVNGSMKYKKKLGTLPFYQTRMGRGAVARNHGLQVTTISITTWVIANAHSTGRFSKFWTSSTRENTNNTFRSDRLRLFIVCAVCMNNNNNNNTMISRIVTLRVRARIGIVVQNDNEKIIIWTI